MLDEAQALDVAALLRGLDQTFKQEITLLAFQKDRRHGVFVQISVNTWPAILRVSLRELAKTRKRGGRDLVTDVGEEYGRACRISMEERRRNQKNRPG